MIADIIKNSNLYTEKNPKFAKAFSFIEEFNKKNLPAGRYEIDGDNVYASVQTYETISENEAKWEAHKKYIDIQYVASGKEIIKWVNIQKLKPVTEYNEEKDIYLLDGDEGMDIKLDSGSFLVLYPEDAHKPKCIWENIQKVVKIVVKVKV